MEKFSEKPQPAASRKRGRPRLDDHGISDDVGRELHTHRGRQNKYYLVLALMALKAAPDCNTRWPWLAPHGFDVSKTVRLPRMSVLYELGRLKDPDTIREMADEVCTGVFPATEAIRRIRAWRLDAPILPEAQPDELVDLLAKTIDQYGATHNGLTQEATLDALEDLKAVVEDEWPDRD